MIVGVISGKAEFWRRVVDWIVSYSERNQGVNLIINESLDSIYRKSSIVFCAGYTGKISSFLLSKVPLGTVNIHQSYRMKYKGRNMNTHVLENKDDIHGTSLHYMNDVIDDGDIIDTDFFNVSENDTAYTLNEKCIDIAIDLLGKNFDSLLQGIVKSNHNHHPKSKRYKKSEINHRISYGIDGSDFERKVRSLTFPGAPLPYTVINGKKIKLLYEDN